MTRLTALAALFAALFSLSAYSFSRGPYLPNNDTIAVPSGKVVFQDGFGEDPDYSNVVWDDEAHELYYLVMGQIVIELPNGQYEVATAEYSCVSIDDGAYGALACEGVEYIATGAQIFDYCEFGVSRWEGFYCE